MRNYILAVWWMVKHPVRALLDWDDTCTMRQLAYTAQHPYRSLAWHLLDNLTSLFYLVLIVSVIFGQIHLVIT